MKTPSKRKPGMSCTSIEQLEPRRLLASPELLLDIEPGPDSSNVADFTNVNGTVFFVKFSDPFGLWKSDGTPEGTVEVRAGVQIDNPVAVGDTLFFTGNDLESGFELWTSDGTTAGTQMIKDINPGPGHSHPQAGRAAGGAYYFQAFDDTNGWELWRSDGTTEGTVLLGDIMPGGESSFPGSFVELGGLVFFSADDGVNGRELWVTDGTPGGTELFLDINVGPASSVAIPGVVIGGTLFFTANDGTTGRELWKTDGTVEGTELVADIRPGSDGSEPSLLTSFGGALYFMADDGDNGPALWRSDGTAAGTELVKDIRAGTASPGVNFLVPAGDLLFFSADDGVHGRELWKSDGTTVGTQLVEDINPGSSNPGGITAIGSTVFFGASDGVHGLELWRSDGTAAGTELVEDILPGSGNGLGGHLTAVGPTLFFTANDGEHGFEPWILDTTDDDGGGDGEGVVIDFENLPLGFIDSGVYEQEGFVFANVPGDGGSPTDRLRVDGGNQGYESKILTTFNWARRIAVDREDGSPFSVERFDYAAGRWNEPGDFVLTGHFADGSTDTRTISFSNRDLVTLELNWENVVGFDLNAAGGVNNAYFAVDNFVFNTPDDEGPPFITGSLADPDPVAGPARLRFDERTWHEIDQLVALPDGGFYAFGRSGDHGWDLPRVPPVLRVAPNNIESWVTRHFADGSIDRSFGDNGRISQSALPWDGHQYRLELISLGTGDSAEHRLLGISTDEIPQHIARFTLDFERDTAFADEGILRPEEAGTPIEFFAFDAFDDGGLAVVGGVSGESVLQIYSPDGDLVRSAKTAPILEPVLPPETGGGGGVEAGGSHDSGWIYFGVLKTSGDSDSSDPEERPFAGAVRLTTDLEIDTSFSGDGVARFTGIFPIEGLRMSDLAAAKDGDQRVLVGWNEDDGDRNFAVFDGEGGVMGAGRYYAAPDFDSRGTLVDVNFLPQGDVAIAHLFVEDVMATVVESLSPLRSTGFGVDHFDFGEPSGGSGSRRFYDPSLPAGINGGIATTGGFIIGGFLEDVEVEDEEPLVTDIDHVGGLWHVDSSA